MIAKKFSVYSNEKTLDLFSREKFKKDNKIVGGAA